MSQPSTEPATDVVLSAVASNTRRAVLKTLLRAEGDPVDLETLTDSVLDELPADGPAGRSRQDVRTALHHTHLPKLSASGLIVHEEANDGYRASPGDLSQNLLAVVDRHEASD